MVVKKIKYFFLFTFLVFALGSCGRSADNYVVMVEKTKSFHREGCPKVNMAKDEYVSIQIAIEKGYKPCPNCKPEKR